MVRCLIKGYLGKVQSARIFKTGRIPERLHATMSNNGVKYQL